MSRYHRLDPAAEFQEVAAVVMSKSIWESASVTPQHGCRIRCVKPLNHSIHTHPTHLLALRYAPLLPSTAWYSLSLCHYIRRMQVQSQSRPPALRRDSARATNCRFLRVRCPRKSPKTRLLAKRAKTAPSSLVTNVSLSCGRHTIWHMTVLGDKSANPSLPPFLSHRA